MSFELRHLRYFIAVAEELHFGRAAKRLGMAQPPLSQQVAALERILEVRLFSRSSRQVRLTPAGEALLTDARRILRLAARAAAAAGAAARGETGLLTVGLSASAAFGLMPPLLRLFRQRHPGVEVVLQDGRAETHLSELEAGALDVALIRGPYLSAAFRVETVQREPIVAVVPAGHALAGRTDVPWAALQDEDCVLFPRSESPPLYDAIIANCLSAGFVPRVTHQATQWLTVSALVAAGLGLTFAPASAADVRIRGVEFVPLSGGKALAELVAVWRPDEASPLPENFARAAQTLMNTGQAGNENASGGDSTIGSPTPARAASW